MKGKKKNNKRKSRNKINNPPNKRQRSKSIININFKFNREKDKEINIDISNSKRKIQIAKTGDNIEKLKIKNKKDSNKAIIKVKNNKIYSNKKKDNSQNNKFINKLKFGLNDYEINRLPYNIAKQYDKRTYFQYYWSLLKKGHIILFAIINKNDYNSIIIKICLFFFSFALYYTINALFFTDATMHKILLDEGEYDFIYQIPQIIYSTLICSVVNIIVKTVSLTEKDILSLKLVPKHNLDKKILKLKRFIKIKFILFFLISFMFLILFWFYVSCFCAVYKNTQIYLIDDTLISFGLSLIYPLWYYLIPGIFRITALRNKKKIKECMYKISLLIQSI